MKRKPYKNAIENRWCIIIALAEIMQIKPFREINVTEVCKKAGISKNTFYRHFENLSDVIYQAIDEINTRLLAETYSLKTHNIEDFILLVCNGWYNYRELYKGFTQDETIYIIRAMIKKDIMHFFERYKIERNSDDLFFEFFSAAFCIFLRWWSLHDFSQPPEEISGQIKEYLYGNVFEDFEKYL